MTKMRIERDSMGELQVPEEALYGAQTQRAINNFPVSGRPMPKAFITALIQVKQAAAHANGRLHCITSDQAAAIESVCELLLRRNDLMQHFPVDVYQTGSGTSTNMNANEVIAKLAGEVLGRPVCANDHVNYGQSSNDVIPTTIHVSASLALVNQLLPALRHLRAVINEKAASDGEVVKTGRTHLMDAMPLTLAQSMSGWAAQIEHRIEQLEGILPGLLRLAQGGTAVGTGINAHPQFARQFAQALSETTGLTYVPADNYFALLASQDTAVALSGLLKATAVTLMKVANDLRWMNSGPLAGLGEITLEALQPGSSIMPGKVNPVIPEAVAMVSTQVIGLDQAITVAGQAGNFELNVMLPLIASNLLESLALLTNAATLLADKAIAGFRVNHEQLAHSVGRNPVLVTALNPIIGYMRAAEIAKEAYKQNRPIIDVAEEMTDISRAELEVLLSPQRLTHPSRSC